jgi:hypothetical protein
VISSHYIDPHPQEELAKFDYSLESKVENFNNPTKLWQPIRTYCLNMAIKNSFPQNLTTLALVSTKILLHESHSIFLKPYLYIGFGSSTTVFVKRFGIFDGLRWW